MKQVTFALLLLLILAPFASSCSSQTGQRSGRAYVLAPLVQMPPNVQEARAPVRQAYQFAVFNPDVLAQLPCTCGCVAMGHTSNYSCYIQGESESGEIVYDNHALGCAICVDITQDAMRLLEEGKSIDQIQDHVGDTYSRFGPATPLE